MIFLPGALRVLYEKVSDKFRRVGLVVERTCWIVSTALEEGLSVALLLTGRAITLLNSRIESPIRTRRDWVAWPVDDFAVDAMELVALIAARATDGLEMAHCRCLASCRQLRVSSAVDQCNKPWLKRLLSLPLICGLWSSVFGLRWRRYKLEAVCCFPYLVRSISSEDHERHAVYTFDGVEAGSVTGVEGPARFTLASAAARPSLVLGR